LYPATNPKWTIERVVKLHDTSASYVMRGEFQGFTIPFAVGNIVLDSHCLIAVETSYGVMVPLEK
jgi:hypothetical protein